MITIYNMENRQTKQGKEYVSGELRGMSTDTKPTKIGEKEIENGSVFIEIDTQKLFFFDADSQEWKGE